MAKEATHLYKDISGACGKEEDAIATWKTIFVKWGNALLLLCCLFLKPIFSNIFDSFFIERI
jgi:hypothetical protein